MTASKIISALNTKSNDLSFREKKLWNVIRSNSGVLMAYGIPGISKSATFRSIADKLDMQYIDLRTSTMDETQLGAFPTVSEINHEGRSMKVVDDTVPAWAIEANNRPTLIHFEELNRCSANVRSAALGILLEKIIGAQFKFNENVFMVASGNPATDHDMDVEEFGSALRNRLIPIQFSLHLKDWQAEFASKKDEDGNARIINEVSRFLKNSPDYFGNTITQLEKFMDDEDNMTQYPSPRSWTFLSDYVKMFDSADRKEALMDVKMMESFVGEKAAVSFINYVAETYKISVQDVLEGDVDYDQLDEMSVQRLTQEFQDNIVIHELNKKHLENWTTFVSFMSVEIRAGHISSVVSKMDSSDPKQIKFFNNFLSSFKKDARRIKDTISNG
jgi:Mg-chelatase subunit ChlI